MEALDPMVRGVPVPVLASAQRKPEGDVWRSRPLEGAAFEDCGGRRRDVVIAVVMMGVRMKERRDCGLMLVVKSGISDDNDDSGVGVCWTSAFVGPMRISTTSSRPVRK